ncbi:MAG TPA: hypothetical protein VFR65_01845 [Nitrososphaeraceae archaeon]|jgi:hypothetical protein|nr:hypothetical protein [Nitrososphaeraceae archaeon]HSL13154.1 hypothetical protein [Nitrososphaeraceae archaeon]
MSHLNGNTDSNQGSQGGQGGQTTQWADLISTLFDRLTGKEAVITYEFDNLIVDIPKAAGPGGKELGSAKWTINGKLIIKAEAHSQSKY